MEFRPADEVGEETGVVRGDQDAGRRLARAENDKFANGDFDGVDGGGVGRDCEFFLFEPEREGVGRNTGAAGRELDCCC